MDKKDIEYIWYQMEIGIVDRVYYKGYELSVEPESFDSYNLYCGICDHGWVVGGAVSRGKVVNILRKHAENCKGLFMIKSSKVNIQYEAQTTPIASVHLIYGDHVIWVHKDQISVRDHNYGKNICKIPISKEEMREFGQVLVNWSNQL